jgi:hypothetical protein
LIQVDAIACRRVSRFDDGWKGGGSGRGKLGLAREVDALPVVDSLSQVDRFQSGSAGRATRGTKCVLDNGALRHGVDARLDD